MSSTDFGSSDLGVATLRSRVRLRVTNRTRSSYWALPLFSLVLIVATIGVYYPVHRCAFLPNVDDATYVTRNIHVLGPLDWPEIQWAFTHPYVLNYDPLTFLAHSINVRLFHLNAGLHHDVNVFLHVLDVLLLFCVFSGSTGRTARSFMVAALFALHPINVENVAWISELKTLLSAAFFFGAMIAYLWYARQPRLWRMLWVGFLYGLGLLAKPQIITLPFVLLLWDYWPLNRMFATIEDGSIVAVSKRGFQANGFWRLVSEKWPLFLITAVDVLLTLHAENKPEIERYTFLIRLGTAIRSYVVYVGKALWPTNLGFNYPHPGYGLRWAEVWLSLAVLVAITVVVLASTRHRYFFVGWFWFLGTMLPTINLVQIDLPAVADRYAYLCFIGLFLMVCWGVADLANQQHVSPAILSGASIAVLLILALISHNQLRYWKDGIAVWRRALQVAPNNNPGAEWALGTLLLSQGKTDEALPLMHKAVDQGPADASRIMSLAEAEHLRGNRREAILYYQKALAVSDNQEWNAEMYANMGHAYGDLGDGANALKCYREAQHIRSTLVSAQ